MTDLIFEIDGNAGGFNVTYKIADEKLLQKIKTKYRPQFKNIVCDFVLKQSEKNIYEYTDEKNSIIHKYYINGVIGKIGSVLYDRKDKKFSVDDIVADKSSISLYDDNKKEHTMILNSFIEFANKNINIYKHLNVIRVNDNTFMYNGKKITFIYNLDDTDIYKVRFFVDGYNLTDFAKKYDCSEDIMIVYDEDYKEWGGTSSYGSPELDTVIEFLMMDNVLSEEDIHYNTTTIGFDLDIPEKFIYKQLDVKENIEYTKKLAKQFDIQL